MLKGKADHLSVDYLMLDDMDGLNNGHSLERDSPMYKFQEVTELKSAHFQRAAQSSCKAP